MNGVLRTAALLATMLAASAAHAHAFMERAAPAVGSVVHGAPTQVELKFSQPLEPVFSDLKVLDGNGKRIDRNDKAVDPSDKTVMRVSLPALTPGTYKVVWRALSIDTHVSQGDYTFELAP